MQFKITIEDFKKEYYNKFPDSKLNILELLPKNKVKIKDDFGECIVYRNNILLCQIPTIQSAINKNEYFANKASVVHNFKYSYSLVEYKGAFDRIRIICPIHGEFQQMVCNHLKGAGCNKCGIIQTKSTTNDFIEKAIKVHGNKYNYNKVDYETRNKTVTITCTIHSDFEQDPSSHLNGSGCPKCANLKRGYHKELTTDYFIEKANKVHNNKYDYSLANYVKSNQKIDIICKIHGHFKQASGSHLAGRGCQQCKNELTSRRVRENPTGWSYSAWYKTAQKSKNFDSFKVYIIRCWNKKEEFFKIGKTFELIKNRFDHKRAMPYSYEIIQIFEFKELTEENCRKCCKLEKELQKLNKEFKYFPIIEFGGDNECFKQIKN